MAVPFWPVPRRVRGYYLLLFSFCGDSHCSKASISCRVFYADWRALFYASHLQCNKGCTMRNSSGFSVPTGLETATKTRIEPKNRQLHQRGYGKSERVYMHNIFHPIEPPLSSQSLFHGSDFLLSVRGDVPHSCPTFFEDPSIDPSR